MLRLRFNINPATSQPHIYDHGVTEYEVEEVLSRPGSTTYGRGDGRIAFGQTLAGRYLKVIYVPDEIGDGVFVITAYDLTGKPLAAYRRKMRRRR